MLETIREGIMVTTIVEERLLRLILRIRYLELLCLRHQKPRKANLGTTNIDPAQSRRVYDQALSYLVHEIEKSAPNMKL